jgi:CheY-like chemotaxis protein
MVYSPVKVALVEDDLSLQNMYRIKLEIAGFQVATASNGEEGLQMVESFQPDLLLMRVGLQRPRHRPHQHQQARSPAITPSAERRPLHRQGAFHSGTGRGSDSRRAWPAGYVGTLTVTRPRAVFSAGYTVTMLYTESLWPK